MQPGFLRVGRYLPPGAGPAAAEEGTGGEEGDVATRTRRSRRVAISESTVRACRCGARVCCLPGCLLRRAAPLCLDAPLVPTPTHPSRPLQPVMPLLAPNPTLQLDLSKGSAQVQPIMCSTGEGGSVAALHDLDIVLM